MFDLRKCGRLLKAAFDLRIKYTCTQHKNDQTSFCAPVLVRNKSTFSWSPDIVFKKVHQPIITTTHDTSLRKRKRIF